MGEPPTRDERRPSNILDRPSDTIARLLKASSDIVLIVDQDGIVREAAIEDVRLAEAIGSSWIGQPLLDTVTVESRSKVEALLQVSDDAAIFRQEINHVMDGEDLPVRYAAVRLTVGGPLAIVGRDLREMARLQQQFVDLNHALEHDYALQRSTEIQFRVLFETASEAVLIVDATNRRILDANPAAEDLVRRLSRRLTGTPVANLFDVESSGAIQDGLAATRAVGQAGWANVRLRTTSAPVAVTAWLVRNAGAPQFILRLSAGDGAVPEAATSFGAPWAALQHLPEPLVATDRELRILDANEAFLDLVQVATIRQLRGEPLARFLGRHAVDLNILTTRLDMHNAVRRFATVLRGAHGLVQNIEVSAFGAGPGEDRVHAYLCRPAADAGRGAAAGKQPLKAASEMTDLVGRMPLKGIVRESTDVIEELCIQAALELTGDNRASAAEMLGLSRQSLYSKMRRHGLGDLPPDESED